MAAGKGGAVNEFETFAVIVGASLVLGFAAASLFFWIRAELDERRWRRKLREDMAKALVREHRYGHSKRGQL